jgi:hypothetical protein
MGVRFHSMQAIAVSLCYNNRVWLRKRIISTAESDLVVAAARPVKNRFCKGYSPLCHPKVTDIEIAWMTAK